MAPGMWPLGILDEPCGTKPASTPESALYVGIPLLFWTGLHHRLVAIGRWPYRSLPLCMARKDACCLQTYSRCELPDFSHQSLDCEIDEREKGKRGKKDWPATITEADRTQSLANRYGIVPAAWYKRGKHIEDQRSQPASSTAAVIRSMPSVGAMAFSPCTACLAC